MSLPLPTRRIDPESSWAVLVGASEYDSPTLEDIPQATTSVADLKSVLTGRTGDFLKEHVVTVTDPESPDDVLKPLDAIARQRPDVVLFYYVGHGMTESLDSEISPTQLFLSLRSSVDKGSDVLRTGLPVGSVFSRLRSLRAKQSVVVLDCCYASRALDDPHAGDIHVMCATGKTSRARFEATERRTNFTGNLLRLFEEGIPDGPEYLDLNTVFHYLSVLVPMTTRDSESVSRSWRLLRPRQRVTDHSGALSLAANPAHGKATTPEGLAARVRFAQQVSELARHDLLPLGEQRMLMSHANDLFNSIAADGGLPQAVTVEAHAS